jgi:hypothetical protein
MKRIVSTLAAVASLTLLAPVSAEAGFVGLYYRGAADKLSVSLKDGTPVLKLEIAHAPDIPECSGFQFFRRNPPTGELRIIEGPGGEKGTGFGLWQSKACIDAYDAVVRSGNGTPLSYKVLVQEINLYNDFFGLYTNKDELIRKFEAGEFLIAVGYQGNSAMDRTEQAIGEVRLTYQDIVGGKNLFEPNN